MPPPVAAELPEMVLFCTVSVPRKLEMPPPKKAAEFPKIVLFCTVSVPLL